MRKRLKAYLKGNNLKAHQLSRLRKADTPFPISSRNFYMFYLGKQELSPAQYALMESFLNEYEKGKDKFVFENSPYTAC